VPVPQAPIDAARWLPASTDARVMRLIRRALADVGLLEMPPGSNRSNVIDGYNQDAGVAAGSYWCASALGAWWRDAGLEVPPGYASCDNWLTWARRTGRLATAPGLGAAVLYGRPGDASHIGCVVRVTPLVLSVEGNTTVEGAEFSASRNGVAVSLKEVTSRDPVLGYVLPLPVSDA
jgi:hypothetical protein